MQEEKVTISRLENIVGWIGAILLSIGLFIAAFLLAMDCANAESIPNDIVNTFKTELSNYTQASQSQIDECTNYLSNYQYFYLIKTVSGSSNRHQEILVAYNDAGLMFRLYTNDTTNNMVIDITRTNGIMTYGQTSVEAYIIYLDESQSRLLTTKWTSSQTNHSYSNNRYSYSLNNGSPFNDISNASQTSLPTAILSPLNECTVVYNNDTYMYSLSGSSLQNIGTFKKLSDFSNTTVYIPPSSTTGFNVFKYNNLGTDTLRIVPPQNQVPVGTHSSNESTVTFDLVIDGTTIPCEYNSESSYYFESLEYGRAYYEIPLSVLLPSSLNDFEEVYVTNVRYVNTWSNQGGQSGTNTFVYVDKCYLKRSVGNDDVGQVSITHVDTDTGYTDTEINNINTMISNASTLQGSFDVEKNLSGGSTTPFSFSSFQDAVVREIECWHPTGTKTSDWVSITIDGVTYDSGDNMYWLEFDSNSTQSFEHRYNYNVSPYSYVRENNYSGYYDIIYFIVHEQVYDSSGLGFSTLDETYTRYYYFISDRYYNKLILYREMDILTYIKLNNEIGEKTYNYLFDRLLNIDDNLYYYIKDKSVIDNDILDALEDIDNDMQFNLDIVVDLLNKILNALLEIDIEPTDTTAIETKLDEIYTRLGNSNLNNDWYAGYRDWLYGETDNDVVDTPHEWFVDKLNDVKNIYDIFGNTDLHSYYTEMRKVISGISGNSNSYYFDLYFNSGIRNQDFDLHTFSSYNEGGFQ